MTTALFITLSLGLIAILLSWENDRLKKLNFSDKKSLEDRIYQLSVFKDIQEKIAYIKDVEKVMDILMTSLRNFFPYSVASRIVIKNHALIFKSYVEEQVNNDYIKSIEKNMLSSLSSLMGTLPEKIEKNIEGLSLNESVKSTQSSSFHIPLVIKNKVIALVHLSSTTDNLYRQEDMEIMYDLVKIATNALSHFNEEIDTERDRFMSLMTSISDGIFMADNKNNLLLINESAKKILGLTENNIGFSAVVNVLSEGFDLGSKINEAIQTKKTLKEKEISIQDKTLDVFIAPIDNERVSVVLHDMTEYRKSEVSKEDLTNIMVHELRAPLTTIKDSADLIISTEGLEEEKKLKFLNLIHQQSKKLLGQIGSILDTAKLDAGKLVLQKTEGDIAKLVKEEIETFMPQSERKNISLNLNVIADTLPPVSFDIMRISQVIDNLLSNSLKFTPEGGTVKVTIDYKAIPPTEDFLSLDKYIIVSVSDTGVGISKEQQKLLFSKYTQAKNTSEELATQGTGLGLYLVKGIVESHGGRVWVKSEPGTGTTFFFSLPAKDTASPTYEAPKPNSSPLSKLSQTVN